MADNLDNLSDEELLALARDQQAPTDNLDNMSDEELLAQAEQSNIVQPGMLAQLSARAKLLAAGGGAPYIEAGAKYLGGKPFDESLQQAKQYWEEDPKQIVGEGSGKYEVIGSLGMPIPGTGPIGKAIGSKIASGPIYKWAAKQTTKWLTGFKSNVLKKAVAEIPGKQEFMEKASDIGKFAIENKLVGKTYQETLNLSEKAVEKFGAQTKGIVAKISDESAPIITKNIHDKIENDVVKRLVELGADTEAKAVRSEISQLAKNPIQSLKELDDWKTTFNETIKWGKAPTAREKLINRELKKAYKIVNETIEDLVEKNAGAEVLKQYKAAKTSYQRSLVVKKLADTNLAAEFTGKKISGIGSALKAGQEAIVTPIERGIRGAAESIGAGRVPITAPLTIPIRGAAAAYTGLTNEDMYASPQE